MKAYTDLEQSKKLAEILPVDSADMCYGIDDDTLKYNDLPWFIPYHKYTAKEFYIPCWSLAALLDVLPKVTDIIKGEADTENERYMCAVGINDDIIPTFSNNPVDACYEMVIKLSELKKL